MQVQREAFMVELVTRDFQLETESIEAVEILFNFEQVKGYAVAAGLAELHEAQRVLMVYKLFGNAWQEVLELTEDALEY